MDDDTHTPTFMNETRILDLIETLNTRVGELAGRVAALELAVAKPPVEAAYTSPEGWEAKQHAVEANQAVRLSAKIDAVVREIDKLDDRLKAVEESKQRAAEAKCGTGRWRDAKSDPPKAGKEYLVCVMGRVCVSHFTELGWAIDYGYTENRVTHWQELPPPPQPTEPA